MPEAKIRISTTPPFPVLVKYLAKNEDFLSDASKILDIDDSKYEALKTALSEKHLFLDHGSLAILFQNVLGPDGHFSEISRFIWRLHRLIRHESDQPVNQSFALLRDAISKSPQKLSEDDINKLIERIEKLAVEPLALARQYKADQLSEATGIELKDIQLICDIRPIFDETRSEIEGAIPISTMKIDVAGPDGSSSRIEIRLTEEQIADLCSKAQFAKNKILAIKKMLQEKSISMPITSATINERECK